MPRGGQRNGAGRKPGSQNLKTVEIAQAALDAGLSPLEYMLSVMRNEDADPKDRAWAAEKSAMYVHPRPAPVPRHVEFDLPEINKPEDIATALAAISKAVASGQVAPSDAQALAAVIEAQRKAVETTELERRIAALEFANGRA